MAVLLLLQSMGSVGVVHGLSRSTACGNLPGLGSKPVSPALAVGFFIHWTTREVLRMVS